MKRLMLMFFVLLCCGLSWAEKMPIEPGTQENYTSENGKYEVVVTYGELGHSWALKEDGKELWNQSYMESPGDVAISDNGEKVAMTTWGWEDEGGANGVILFNKKGEITKEISFGGSDSWTKDAFKWIKVIAFSPDGKFLALGEGGKESVYVTLYETETGNLIWEKSVGLEDMVEIKISDDAQKILVATRNVSDMEFVLLDKAGQILSSQKIDKNFEYDVKYLKFENNQAFVFDRNKNSFALLAAK